MCSEFKSQFGVYCTAKQFNKLSEDEQITKMLMLMDPDCLSIYKQFQWSRRRMLEIAMQKFDSYFEPVRNVIFERSLFNKLIQEEGQSLDDFIKAVQTQGANVSTCCRLEIELLWELENQN